MRKGEPLLYSPVKHQKSQEAVHHEESEVLNGTMASVQEPKIGVDTVVERDGRQLDVYGKLSREYRGDFKMNESNPRRQTAETTQSRQTVATITVHCGC